ncbi:MAG: division/cell wall cluster transcriptional repressor MraZ [Acidimicrobiales bacterium]
MEGFFGRYDHRLDAKGRLTLPARFSSSFDGGAFLSSYSGGCLALWTPVEFGIRMREMQGKASTSAKWRNLVRVWAAGTYQAEKDGQARIVIPPRLRVFADLASEVVISGAIDHVEIWNPSRWMEMEEPQERMLILGEEAI